MESWPFPDDAPNTAAITTRQVLERGAPIRVVSHDAADGGWQFLCGSTTDPRDGRVVGLRSIVALDPSVATVADLPLGWRARRDGPTGSWRRERCEDDA